MGSLDKARRVLELTKAHELVEQMALASSRQIEKDMGQSNKPEEVRLIIQAVDEVFSKHVPVMIEIVLGGMVAAYSDDELDAMVTFYSSDLGSSIISKQNDVNINNMREISGYNSVIVYPELQRAVNKVLDKIEAEAKIEDELKK